MTHVPEDRSAGTSPPTAQDDFTTFVERFDGVRWNKRGADAHVICSHPNHQGERTGSLHLTLKGDKILMKCFGSAGSCTQNESEKLALLTAKDMTLADLFVHEEGDHPRTLPRVGLYAPVNQPRTGKFVPTGEVYPYTDEQGAPLFEVRRGLRDGKKSFAQSKPDGTTGIEGVRRVLYRMHEWYGKGKALAITEGEKDADRLRELGFQAATTNMGGAGNWKPEYTAQLKGGGIERVAIFVDHDDAGRKHAFAVARDLHGAGIEVRLVMLPGLPEKGDVSDWLDAGHTKEELSAFVKALKVYTPADEPKDERFALVVGMNDEEMFPGEDDDTVEDIEYDWEGFVAKGTIATLLGAKKAAKSWLQNILVVSATQPVPLYPGFPWGGKKVLLISGPMENNKRETRRRIRAVRRQHGIFKRKPGDGEIWSLEYRTAILRNDPKDTSGFEALRADITAFQPDHVFLDSASALWGGKNENDNAEVRTWLEQRVVPLIHAAAPGCTVYLAAHTGHVTRVGNKVFTPEHQRGASAWGDAADSSIMVEAVDPPPGSPEGTVAALVWQKFTRRGEPSGEQFLLTISGGPRSKTPIEVKLARFDQAVKTPGAPHPTRLNVYGDAHKLVKDAGVGGIFKVSIHEALVGMGHGEKSRGTRSGPSKAKRGIRTRAVPTWAMSSGLSRPRRRETRRVGGRPPGSATCPRTRCRPSPETSGRRLVSQGRPGLTSRPCRLMAVQSGRPLSLGSPRLEVANEGVRGGVLIYHVTPCQSGIPHSAGAGQPDTAAVQAPIEICGLAKVANEGVRQRYTQHTCTFSRRSLSSRARRRQSCEASTVEESRGPAPYDLSICPLTDRYTESQIHKFLCRYPSKKARNAREMATM